MQSRLQRTIAALDMEERILNASSLFALLSIFMPWLSGEWLGDDYVSYSGFRFFTSSIGILIFLLHGAVLALTISPLAGGPGIARAYTKEIVRLWLTSQTTILSLAALSVLTSVTYDYTRMEIRFGIYCTFIGSLVATFYAFWKLQEERKHAVQEVFHHPDSREVPHVRTSMNDTPPPPPPPPPLKPEDHHIRP